MSWLTNEVEPGVAERGSSRTTASPGPSNCGSDVRWQRGRAVPAATCRVHSIASSKPRHPTIRARRLTLPLPRRGRQLAGAPMPAPRWARTRALRSCRRPPAVPASVGTPVTREHIPRARTRSGTFDALLGRGLGPSAVVGTGLITIGATRPGARGAGPQPGLLLRDADGNALPYIERHRPPAGATTRTIKAKFSRRVTRTDAGQD